MFLYYSTIFFIHIFMFFLGGGVETKYSSPEYSLNSLEDEPADEFNIEDFLEANEALIHL